VIRLLCTGDWQLGKGGRLTDQADVADRIAAAAIERHVDAVLHAGDVFEGPVVQPEELAVFRRFAAHLREAGIPILVARGNGRHDQARRPEHALAIFADIPNVQVADRPDIHTVGGCTVATLPWVDPGRLVAAHNGDTPRDEINQETARLLVRIAHGLAEDTATASPRVLLGHWHVDAALSAHGQLSSELFHEPLLPLYELEALGFDAVILGHNHRPQLLAADPDDPSIPVFHVGSPMPLDFGETGFDHGVWILELGGLPNDGKSAREFVGHGESVCHARAEFVAIESRRLQQTSFDIADLPVDEFVESLYDPAAWPEVDAAIVKVTLRCTQAQQRRLDLARLREAVLAAGAHTVEIDVDTVREQRSRVDGVTGELDPLDAFDAWAASNEIDPGLVALAREQMQADLEQVGA
jgi:DNA repair exonuclease SbcCD nuclease subunit